MHSRRDFIVKAPLGLAGLTLGASLGGRFAAAQDAAITIAYPGDVSNWDPISSGTLLSPSIYKCVFDMPLNLAPDLSFGPSVAASHRWLDNAGQVLEFNLREGVTFHNGDPLTSDDVKFTFYDRLQADHTLALGGLWRRRLDAIETPSPTRAIFKINSPYVNAPAHIASVFSYIMPRRYFEKVGREEFMKKPIGSGPYRLVDYQRDSRIVLEAYDKYWGGPAKIKQVTFQIIKDASARIAAIQAGQVDLTAGIPVREAVRLGERSGLVSALHPVTNVVLIQMINRGVFRDKNVRLAMHHAIDKEAISKAFYGGKAQPLSMFGAPGSAINDPDFHFPYSPDMARSLLAKSGYGPNKPLKIDFLSFNGRFPSDYDVARALVQMWKKVGIEASLEVVDPAKYSEWSRNDKVPAPTLYSWFNSSGDPASYSGSLLDPKRIFSVWKSDDIVPRLHPLLVEVDNDKRMAGYRKFDAWAVQQGYTIPLMQAINTVVHTERLKYTPFQNGWILPYHWSLA